MSAVTYEEYAVLHRLHGSIRKIELVIPLWLEFYLIRTKSQIYSNECLKIQTHFLLTYCNQQFGEV